MEETQERKKRKFKLKWAIYGFIILVFVGVAARLLLNYNYRRNVQFRTHEGLFQIHYRDQWEDFLVKGVNIGAGKPGFFPGELAITKEEYLRWLNLIGDMNANVIRVYTILEPAFYEALYEYNRVAPNPLWVMQGITNDEEMVLKVQNGFDPQIIDPFKEQIRNMVDIFHGNKTLPDKVGVADGEYTMDVSPYVMGWILGIELDSEFVIGTNEANPNIEQFQGDFLYTVDASPFEIWLATLGDYAISYEYENYGTYRMVSWVNWLTTDPLEHPSEPEADQDAVGVDTENIRATDKFTAGIFSSYHVYPYYPEFMMLEEDYVTYKDDEGKINPYKAYLLDLLDHHTQPVLVAEFGIPTSRGRTHENIVTEFNQGFVEESKAGHMLSQMFDDVVDAGMAGGIVFTWQDEWFKRAWNTELYDLAQRRALWSNYQVSEQAFGLMAFEPGARESISYVDGNVDEWANIDPVADDNGISLRVTSDEKFVYFKIADEDGSIADNEYIIAVNSLTDQGNTTYSDLGLKFANPTEFLIHFNGKDNSSMLVDAYYDVFYRDYSTTAGTSIERNPNYEVNDSGIFNPIRLFERNTLILPETGEIWPPSWYETGRLLHGISNPDHDDFNSLADFFIQTDNNTIEARIPWQLLNIADPSTKTAIGNLYTQEGSFHLNPTQIDGFDFELFRRNPQKEITNGGSGSFSWDGWDSDTLAYHERLKPGFYIMQDNFGNHAGVHGDGGLLHRMEHFFSVGNYADWGSDGIGARTLVVINLSFRVIIIVVLIMTAIILLLCLIVFFFKIRRAVHEMRNENYRKEAGPLLDSIFKLKAKEFMTHFHRNMAKIKLRTPDRSAMNSLEDILLDKIEHGKKDVKNMALIIAYHFKFYKGCLAQLNSPIESRMAANSRKAGLYQLEEALPQLIKNLDVRSADVQYQVLMAICRIGDYDHIELAFDKVSDKILLSQAAINEIIQQYPYSKIDLFKHMLQSENETSVYYFLGAIRQLLIRQLVDDVIPFLDSENKNIRLVAFERLGSLYEVDYVPYLLKGFDDPAWEVVSRTAMTFGFLVVDEAAEPLVRTAMNGNWWVRQMAMDAIVHYPNREELMIRIAKECDPKVYANIIFTLERERLSDTLEKVKAAWLGRGDTISQMPSAYV